jgi:hypothetical protein
LIVAVSRGNVSITSGDSGRTWVFESSFWI